MSADLSIIEKRWVVKTLKVCTSETNYRDLYFSRLCPSCRDGCERGLDGQWKVNKKRGARAETGRGSGMASPAEIKALTDAVANRVRDEADKKYQDMLTTTNAEAAALQDIIKDLKENIIELELSLSGTERTVEVLQDAVAEAKEKYDICKREVFVLRTAVQDSYRAIEENALQQQLEREGRRRAKGTQIACSVCAVRYEVGQHEHDGSLTGQLEESDRVMYPRAARLLQRVRATERLHDTKHKKFALAYAPFVGGDSKEPPTVVTKHRTTAISSAAAAGRPHPSTSNKEKQARTVDTGYGELAVSSPATQQGRTAGSKFSQMKNIPPASGNVHESMTKFQVSKVAALLQSDARIAQFKMLQDNHLLVLTDTEERDMKNLLGSASRNNLESKKQTKNSSQRRPISAPSHHR